MYSKLWQLDNTYEIDQFTDLNSQIMVPFVSLLTLAPIQVRHYSRQ